MKLGFFADWFPPTTAGLREMKAIGASTVIFGVGTSRDARSGFIASQLWNKAKLSRLVRAARTIELEPVVMFWVRRRERYMETMLEWFEDAIESQPGMDNLTVLWDCEKDWRRADYSAAMSLEAATDLLVHFAEDHRLRAGVTGLPVLSSAVLPLAKRVDFTVPQAYSIWKPRDESHWSHSPKTAPMVMQQLANTSWASVNETLRKEGSNHYVDSSVIGLASYWGARPKSGRVWQSITEGQAMRASLAEAKHLGYDQAWFWSWKFVGQKSGKQQLRRKFFLENFYRGSNVGTMAQG